jgi:predicted dehydrogenase
MAEKLKIGVVGVGAIGNVHLDAYKANSDAAEVTAICDIDAEKLKKCGDARNIQNQFLDYNDLMKTDVDAVSVCVWNNVHKEIAIAALKAGKNVLLEKPMAMNPAEAKEIIAAAEKSGKTLQIGMVWRQNKQAQQVRKMIDDGLLGDIYHIRAVLTRRRGIPGLGGWFTTKSRSGGGPLIDLGVHWFDISMYLSGLWNPTSVSAMTYDKYTSDMKNYKFTGMWAGPPKYDGISDVEDYATGFVRFGKKATLNFDISWAGNTQEECFIELIGTKGGVKILNGQDTKLLTELNGQIVDVLPQFACEDESFNRQKRLFLSACRGECAPAATAKEGLTVMKVIDAVYRSAAEGKEVQIAKD